MNGDGVQDIAVGAFNDENANSSEGAVYVLYLKRDGTVRGNIKISDALAGFTPAGLDVSDRW